MSHNPNSDMNPTPQNTNNNAEDGFDVKAFFAKLKADWWVFLISFAVCGILGALFMHYKAPSYNIVSELLIDDGSSNASSAASTTAGSMLDISSLLDLKNNASNEAQVLQTRHLMQKTVESMHLNIIYYIRRAITDQQIDRNPFTVQILQPVDTIMLTTFKLTRLKDGGFNLSYKETNPDMSTTRRTGDYKYGDLIKVAGVGVIKITQNPIYAFTDNNYRFDIESVDQAIYNLQQVLTISMISTTVSTINLTFDYPIPRQGEAILRTLIAAYMKQNVQLQNEVADSTIAFINNRLIIVSTELNQIEHNVQDFKQENKLADLTEQGKLLLGTTNNYMDLENKNETSLSIIASLLDYLRDETKNKTVVPVSVLPDDPIFAKLVDTYNELLIEKDKQSISVTNDNPFMQNLDARIVTLRKDMIRNLLTTQQSLQITNQKLKATNNGFANQIAAVPPKQRVYLDLTRQQDITQTLYTFLLQKKEETEISKTSNLSIATLIDPPKSDYKPYSPNLFIVIAAVVFLGLVFPPARILALDMLNRKILVREDISKNTSVPIVGEISHNKSENNLVFLDSTRSAIAEQFRSLRTNLQYFVNKADEKVILVTSSISGEGKSFTTINLAGAMALTGKKVLLMELDLRKPKVSGYFGIDNTNGFSNYMISEDMDVSSIIAHSAFNENLYIISSGPIPPNPAELILDERADALFVKLREQFDFIIIDAPPIGIVTDAQLMSRFADMALYIVRQNYTLKDQLKIVEDLYVHKRMNKIAIIVNDIESKRGYGYGYSYGYGAYGYGYGYYEDDKKSFSLGGSVKKLFKRSK